MSAAVSIAIMAATIHKAPSSTPSQRYDPTRTPSQPPSPTTKAIVEQPQFTKDGLRQKTSDGGEFLFILIIVAVAILTVIAASIGGQKAEEKRVAPAPPPVSPRLPPEVAREAIRVMLASDNLMDDSIEDRLTMLHRMRERTTKIMRAQEAKEEREFQAWKAAYPFQ
ncbi:MAG: hypothetical protein EOP83_09030 [Verrucomicrobiaceae bacterium]|nr:MAG: hypothetical protein EOP83_09030 [Verrucomicrobiaceae bacterium]